MDSKGADSQRLSSDHTPGSLSFLRGRTNWCITVSPWVVVVVAKEIEPTVRKGVKAGRDDATQAHMHSFNTPHSLTERLFWV